ncbi:heterokaryon incompatibility protein-domain-containing protein [Xylariaceae sp. FL1019]|nr:heterokaryon incompatibility protein-domain-containing protein [Xylariaceae sp. FL1019]
MTAKYIYQPLSKDEKQLRLLDLQPGSGTICCRLRQVPFNSPGDYEALSYVWGKETTTCQILVDDQLYRVGRNLHTALKYLRRDTEAPLTRRTLWIDAICLNQEDDNEKRIYVPLMSHIYRSCWRTLIWLGEHDWLTRSAVNGVEFLSSMHENTDLPSHVISYTWREVRRQHLGSRRSWLGSVRAAVEGLHAQLAFQSVFDRPWFTRVWVVQELALSRNAVFLCGVHKMDWADIVKAEVVASHFFPGSPFIMQLLLQKWPADHGPHDIGTHMLATWAKEAAKPQDKIYGLMGLPSTEGKDVVIDVNYAKSDDETFTDFTATYLRQTGNLRILAISRGCKAETTRGIPSWAVDYQNYNDLPEAWAWFGCGQYLAGGSQPCQAVVEGGMLSVQGFVLDSVIKVSVVSKIEREGSFVRNVIVSIENAMHFSWFFLDCQRMCREYDSDETVTATRPRGYYAHSTNQTISAAFWKTVYAQTIVMGAGNLVESPEERKIREKVAGMLSQLSGLVTLVGHWAGSLILIGFYVTILVRWAVQRDVQYGQFFAWISFTKKRRFFITETGYFGLGPPETQLGDEIAVLQGGRAPLVTRPGEPRRIVGESFVQGIMSGEAYDQKKCQVLWFG